MNFPEGIKNANWLSESQRARLRAVYSTIEHNDIEHEAFEMLNLSEPGEFNCPPCEYKNMVVDLMSRLSLMHMSERDTDDYRALLWKLYLFFDVLDSDNFYTLCNIEEARSYKDDNGGHEKNIDKLYRETLNKTKEKLRLLETV